MSTITILYNVTENVRRSELGAGRDASRERAISISPTPALASIANLTGGDGCVDLRCLDEADHVLSDETVEAWVLATHAKLAESRAASERQLAEARAAREARDLEKQKVREAREDARLSNPDLDWATIVDSDGTPVWNWKGSLERWPRALERAKAARAERDADLAEISERQKNAAKSYVLAHVPDYARAASEGCDVRHRATEHLLARLKTELGAFKTYRDDEHTCPSAAAYAKLDDVRAKIAWTEMEGASLTITRSDLDSRRERNKFRTCVHIEHVLPWGDDVDLAVLAEPEPDDDDASDN